MLNRSSLGWMGLWTLLSTGAYAAAADTPDYWQCANRIGGSWLFGQVPSGCDVDPFADPQYVRQTFDPVLYRDTFPATGERPRYVQEMYTVLRDATAYYLKIRKPAATADEKAAWLRAVLAVAAQETYWTQYRAASDGRTKMVRGDFGHGHGMMQIDDRWHFAEIGAGKGWQLARNISYALDIYYAAWEKAAAATCVAGASDWRNRARSAYSQYNGGASRICRFTNPNDTWARNDINFAQKYDQQAWNTYVTNPSQPAKVNIACLMEGKEVCPPVNWTPADWSARYLKTESGDYCMFKSDALTCVAKVRDLACTSAFTGISPSAQEVVGIVNKAGYPKSLRDRHLCPASVSGLKAVGRIIATAANINLRTTPGGALVLTVPSGSALQILDWEDRNAPDHDRYYRVRYQSATGWIYGGNKADYAGWAADGLYTNAAWKSMPQLGYKGKVVMAGGINLRSVPETGTVLTVVPQGSVMTVSGFQVSGDSNSVYYKTVYNGKTGWLYGGQTLPDQTTASWIQAL